MQRIAICRTTVRHAAKRLQNAQSVHCAALEWSMAQVLLRDAVGRQSPAWPGVSV
jgi:hypothetical protein